VKLFQIEEPDGSPADDSLPGAAIGIDLSGAQAMAAFSVGGNAVPLDDREGFVQVLPVPAEPGTASEWQAVFEGVRRRTERLLVRPVTHAVVVLTATTPDAERRLGAAAAAAGIELLRFLDFAELAAGQVPALAAAQLAEDLMPRPGTGSPTPAYLS
jgi:hypothetical protein